MDSRMDGQMHVKMGGGIVDHSVTKLIGWWLDGQTDVWMDGVLVDNGLENKV